MTPISTFQDDLTQIHEKLDEIEQTVRKIDRMSLFADLMIFFSNCTTFTHHPRFRNILINKINHCRNEIRNARHIEHEQEGGASFDMLQVCERLEDAVQQLEVSMHEINN